MANIKQEPTKVVRIPMKLVEHVEQLVAEHKDRNRILPKNAGYIPAEKCISDDSDAVIHVAAPKIETFSIDATA